jgi:hypothetical protein
MLPADAWREKETALVFSDGVKQEGKECRQLREQSIILAVRRSEREEQREREGLYKQKAYNRGRGRRLSAESRATSFAEAKKCNFPSAISRKAHGQPPPIRLYLRVGRRWP